MSELVGKKSQGCEEEKQFMKCFIDAGFNDFYLRDATEEGVQKILQCDESFVRGFMSKVLTKLRSNCLPPEAKAASTEDYNEAVQHFGNCKPEHGKQSEYINDLFFTKNINMQHAILSRKLRGLKSDREGKPSMDQGGRAQLLSDDICRNVITPALENYRAKGQAKWTPVVKLLMRQLLRIQEGIEAPQGILKLIQQSEEKATTACSILPDEEDDDGADDGADDDASIHSKDTEPDIHLEEMEETFSDQSDDEDTSEFSASAQHSQESQAHQLLRHVGASKLSAKRLEFNEFPSNKTFKRYKLKYGWHERKLEVLAAHRQAGSSPGPITANYEELGQQYIRHDIKHPDQILVTDEIRWCKSWENALALISCLVGSNEKRGQSGGPGKLKDGVTATPISSIIGTLICIQIILMDSQKAISDAAIIAVMVAAGFLRESIVVHRTKTGYQTAESFKKLFSFLTIRLHALEGTAITDNILSLPLKRRYIVIADGSTTHPFHDLIFALAIAIVGIFMHQQENNSTHVTNLYDRYVFLLTKLYAAKEVMMAILIQYQPPIDTDDLATIWLEKVMKDLKGTIDPDKEGVSSGQRMITDPAVIAKLDKIVTFKSVIIESFCA